MILLKIVHLFFVFVWIGSLLILSRLLTYFHRETPEVQTRLALIFRKMYLFVDLPSLILTVVSGLILFTLTTFGPSLGWFHMKITFVLLLIVADIFLGKEIIKLQTKPITGKEVRYKILHYIIVLFLIGTLCSIYAVRNKTQEIKDRFAQEYASQK